MGFLDFVTERCCYVVIDLSQTVESHTGKNIEITLASVYVVVFFLLQKCLSIPSVIWVTHISHCETLWKTQH